MGDRAMSPARLSTIGAAQTVLQPLVVSTRRPDVDQITGYCSCGTRPQCASRHAACRSHSVGDDLGTHSQAPRDHWLGSNHLPCSRPIHTLLPRLLVRLICWHLPAAHDAAMRVPALRAAEYALILGTALGGFWWQDQPQRAVLLGGGV